MGLCHPVHIRCIHMKRGIETWSNTNTVWIFISDACVLCIYVYMGWLRWVGCLKIQVSLQNTGLFCRALLQKRPTFLSILLIVATPYQMFEYLFLTRVFCAYMYISNVWIFISNTCVLCIHVYVVCRWRRTMGCFRRSFYAKEPYN